MSSLISRRRGAAAEARWLQGLVQSALSLEPITRADLARCADLVDRYADSDIGLVDASLVAIAERLRITRVLTLDHRHLGIVRPRHRDALELLP